MLFSSRFTLFSPFFLLLLQLCLRFSPALTLDLSRSYQHGPIPFDSKAHFYFSINLNTSTAHLAILLTDSSVVSNASNWIGLGIAEPSSGSMLGSDVITAQFAAGQSSKCTFVDRYVPFYASPLGKTTNNATGARPINDDCQNDASWTLVRCQRSAIDRQMLLEVYRPLAAHDSQDRDIVPGDNSVIYAHGMTYGYHAARRSSIRVRMYNDANLNLPVAQSILSLPKDVDGSVLIGATGYIVPSEPTTYACTSFKLDIKPGQKRMIVAAEPVLNATSSAMVHHLTFWLCKGEEYAALTAKTIECGGRTNKISGPQGGQQSQCSTLIYGYAKGGTRMVVPSEAGFLLDSENYILVLETHYDNPTAQLNNVDFSGVRMYYTDTLRQHEAGTLILGDAVISRGGQTVKHNFKYESTCTSGCTRKFSGPVSMFFSFLHMHKTGREIYTNKFDENGTFIENISKVNFWSDNFQIAASVNPTKTLRPGEQLQTTCIYDTRKKPHTIFGRATVDEMCMNFIAFWPIQRDTARNTTFNICGYYEDSNGTDTLCGDLNAARDIDPFLNVQNPSFEDTIGAPTNFGTANTCSKKPEENDEEKSAESSSSPTDTESGVSSASTESNEGSATTDGNDNNIPPTAESNEGSITTEGNDNNISPTAESNEGSRTTEGNDNANDTSPTAQQRTIENTCFPSSATVQLRNGELKRMDELRIGDSVLVEKNRFSRVFAFTHRSKTVMYKFVELRAARSKLQVRLTRGHFLAVNGKLSKAGDAKKGDTILLGDGSEDIIAEKRIVTDYGLYNAQTLDGNIVVDGVISSTYTETIKPVTAHSLLTPLRTIYMFAIWAKAMVFESV